MTVFTLEPDAIPGAKQPTKSQLYAKKLSDQFRAFRLPRFETEYEFLPGRKYAADWHFPDYRLLVEMEGITPTVVYLKGKGGKLQKRFVVLGGHTEVKGYFKDLDKYNSMTERGYHLIRIVPKWIDDPHYTALNWVIRGLTARGWQQNVSGHASGISPGPISR